MQAAAADATARKAAYTALAEAYLRLNRPEDSAAARAKAEALPNDTLWTDPLLNQMEKVHTGLIPRLDKAEILFRNGLADEALEQLLDVINDHPESDEAQMRLADWHIRQNHPEAAEPALRAALAINPGLAEAHFKLAGVLMLRKDYAAAEESYLPHHCREAKLRAGPLSPGPVPPEAGQPGRRRGIVPGRGAHTSDLAPGHLALGELLLKAGKRDEAVPYLENALRLEPANPPQGTSGAGAEEVIDRTCRNRRCG